MAESKKDQAQLDAAEAAKAAEAEAEAKAKAEAEAKAKAEAEAKAKAEAEAKAKPKAKKKGAKVVAEGVSVTSKRGILLPGEEVQPKDLGGGEAAFKQLIEKKKLV